jgi:predicted AlkP superfamily pyrophosphatase or phosphodiesterase
MRPAAALVPLAALTAAVTGVALFALSLPGPPAPPPLAPPRPAREARPRLAVLVVFDQLRGDYLERWRPLFGPAGFARLQRDGAWFTDCHYPYAVTTTGPGHASMLSGACPDAHGVVDNDWYEDGKRVYCAGRDGVRLEPPLESDDRNKPAQGGTPERLLSETVADVLKRETNGRAKVFGVSLKDRSAVLPTGQRPDGAYWFDKAFRTSTYYTRYAGDVPLWVYRFNASRAADRWLGAPWTRLGEEAVYDRVAGPDKVAGEYPKTAFPHTIGGPKPDAAYYAALAASPFGNDLVLAFTKTCVTEERLGLHDVPDLLVVSFSSNDLVGHAWGPDSHEVLDTTLRSDAVVAELLAFLDDRVGKDRYLLGLTADHGVCPLPGVTREKGRREGRKDWQEADRAFPAEWQKALGAHLSERFAGVKPADWTDLSDTSFYFRKRAVAASGVSREQLAAEAAKFLAAQRGVARTFTRAELSGPVPAADAIATRMKRSFHPARSGDVIVLVKEYWIPAGKTDKPSGTTHGTPYDYDTHVPLIVYGPGIRGGTRDEPTTPQALASVFANGLGIPRPKDAAFPIPTTLNR